MKICLVGYGAMGHIVYEMANNEISAICDINYEKGIKNLSELKDHVDVILDFSNPANLDMIYEYAIKNNTPVVLATTGYNIAAEAKINELAKFVPVLKSANFSLGVLVMDKVLEMITPILKDSFDIEIVEAHHHNKVDAPSGTAKMFLNTLIDKTNYEPNFGRYGNEKRKTNEIGVSSIRGGSIVGEHEVLYCGEDEVLSIKHSASSRKIFAKGALLACKFIVKQEKGLYNMKDVLFKGE